MVWAIEQRRFDKVGEGGGTGRQEVLLTPAVSVSALLSPVHLNSQKPDGPSFDLKP